MGLHERRRVTRRQHGAAAPLSTRGGSIGGSHDPSDLVGVAQAMEQQSVDASG